ncbi:MAG: AmmeMemoRadiSam system protein A [Patescibacteria group bacterium]|jgi:AmmeMemoRadiSam system protein A
MEKYTREEKKFLLRLARDTIEFYFANHDKLTINVSTVISENLMRKRAAFVTLTQNGVLRGCIGSLEPELPLYEEIIDKAYAAAFRDLRFPALAEDELKKTQIDISILAVPQPLSYYDYQDLLAKINLGKDGIVLKKNGFSATFLPSVWKEINDKEEFLSSLCHKAGLPTDAWKKDTDIFTYQTVEFSE